MDQLVVITDSDPDPDADTAEDDGGEPDDAQAGNRPSDLMDLARELGAESRLKVKAATYTLEADLLGEKQNVPVLRNAYRSQHPRSKQWQEIETAADPARALYQKPRKSKKFISMQPRPLSEEQRKLVDYNEGHLFAEACPGAGKTRAIVARYARRAGEEPRKGIALVSFTNAAIDEVGSRCGDRQDALKAPHFVGTFDGFINRFISRPLYVYFYDKTRLSCAASRVMATGLLQRPVFEQRFGRLLADRFSEVIVDEAQDCGPEELFILRLLKRHGVTVVTVADLDQSIFAFRRADPKGVRAFTKELGIPLAFNGNCRSSPAICALNNSLRSGDRRETATGDNASCELPARLSPKRSRRSRPQ